MTLELSKVLPNIESGLANSGFLFGAGTSVEAGYPVMTGLTQSVVGALDLSARGDLDEVLGAISLAYNDTEANPNIEVIADLVMQHAITSGDARFTKLEERLRQLVTEVILSVSNPSLDHHVRFLELLKRRGFGRATNVYILTTNYDVLFELAGAQAGVVVETGFVGSVERFFDQQRFATASGALQPANRFSEHPVLTIRLIKLHGSVSWVAQNGNVIERHPASITSSEQRVMVLPRRRKVMDTLQHPFDVLFAVTSRVLGADCKYMASCGFSFGDDHINQNLMTPAVNNGRIKLFALCMEETDGLAEMKSASAFSAGFHNGGIQSGTTHTDGTDCWKFSRFGDLFE